MNTEKELEKLFKSGKKIYFELVLEKFESKVKQGSILIMGQFDRPNHIGTKMQFVKKGKRHTIQKAYSYIALGGWQFKSLKDFHKNYKYVTTHLTLKVMESRNYQRWKKGYAKKQGLEK